MLSSKPAPAAGSAVLFSAEQRSALLGDPSVTEKTMFGTTALCGYGRTSKTWAAAPASGSDCWPELALAAWAFAGT